MFNLAEMNKAVEKNVRNNMDSLYFTVDANDFQMEVRCVVRNTLRDLGYPWNKQTAEQRSYINERVVRCYNRVIEEMLEAQA